MIRQYALNMAMAVDQFLSTVLGGHPDDTVSQRLGRAQLHQVKWTKPFQIAVDFAALVLVGERNHCLNSLSGKTMAKELWNWGGSRADILVEEVK
jgi:hypothetical protein